MTERPIRLLMLCMFDVAITIHTLISLSNWSVQKEALQNIASVLVSGGLYVFTEGLRDGRARLDSLRKLMGLNRIPTVLHNTASDRVVTLEFLDRFLSLRRRLGSEPMIRLPG